MNKNKNNRDPRNNKGPRSLTNIPDTKDAGMPSKEGFKKESELLFTKTLSGLPKTGSSLTVKADPYALTLPESDPYALLNKLNAKAGGKYAGRFNLDGGITNQIITSNLSNFLHCFDTFMLRCKVNYRYLPIKSTDTTRGKGFVREMIHAVDEVISIAKSTTYTQLAINQYYIKTDLPIDGVSDMTKERSLGTPEGLYALLVTYQTYLQSFANIFNSYNKFRANQGAMLAMSWNRETAKLNSYFTLMNKNSMVGQFNSLAFVLNGEYFDQEWMRQFNLISSLVSRKSNAMSDPLKEIVCSHSLPKFELYTKTTAGDSSTNVMALSSDQLDAVMKTSSNAEIKTLTYEAALDLAIKRLSVNDTLYWVRNPQAYAGTTEQLRFNYVSDLIDCMIIVADTFKTAMGDLRTMLDVVQRVGANAWTKSTKLQIFTNLNSSIINNLTVDDLYHSLLSGTDRVKWDKSTFRWVTATIWDYYYGIPEYDNISGGSFLTFSTKTLDNPDEFPGAVDYLPVFINGFLNDTGERGGYVYAVNRLGTSVELKYATFNPSVNPSSARLVPLSTNEFTVRIPYTSATLTPIDRSHLQAACLKTFGSFSNASTANITASTDLAINPDYLCYITVEIDDLVNEMITYARTKGPFVVNYDDKSSIGFLGLE